MIRRLALTSILVAAALGAAGGAMAAGAPSCKDLQDRRLTLVQESTLTTSNVEAKNVQLGEAADALAKSKDAARKVELERRVDGLRRELSALLDREHSTTDQLGALDAEIAKKCLKGGRR